jgi:hypothetical protein
MTHAPLVAVILELMIVFRGQATVYARHMRTHPSGVEARATTLGAQLEWGALLADVELVALTALVHDESAMDHARVSPVGAFGAAQLMPHGRYARGYRADVRRLGPSEAEASNIVWGAYALREGLTACGGSLPHAYGFYRTGHCRAGPRARHTMRLRAWIQARMQAEEAGA